MKALEARTVRAAPAQSNRAARSRIYSTAVTSETSAECNKDSTVQSGFDGLLPPTVAITALSIAAFRRDKDYRRLNALLLRNTSVVYFLDCCAMTMPPQTADPPVALMIIGEHGADQHFLAVERGVETALNRTR